MRILVKEADPGLISTPLRVVLQLHGPRAARLLGVKGPAARDFLGGFRGTQTLYGMGKAARLVRIGLGKRADLDTARLRRAGAIAAKRAQSQEVSSMILDFQPEVLTKVGVEEAVRAVAEGCVLGGYQFEELRESDKDGDVLGRVTVVVRTDLTAARRGARLGANAAQAACLTRDLQNRPANLMTPELLAAAARRTARGADHITCQVKTPAWMEKNGMGALLGVAQGARVPSRFIILNHRARGRTKGRVAIVGKGITFDSGGISLKPSGKMDEMKYDMSGGAAVVGLFQALRRQRLPLDVCGVVPATENMPGANAQRPGDIVTAFNGTTIEVLNTDAEGRLVLADALSWTIKTWKPDCIIDLATLTGAVVTALGHEITGLMGNNAKLEKEVVDAGNAVDEACWRLPLHEVHREAVKSRVADIKNISGAATGAGSSCAGAFLENFVGDTPWVHMDIAGTAWGGRNRDHTSSKGGSGVAVRTLLRFLETRAGR